MYTVAIVGIRREDKSVWERRVPLVPADVARLQQGGLTFHVQQSDKRAFADADYTRAGARVVPELSEASIIMGVKEIPPERIEPERVYVYFSHTIKGQPANMPALRRLIEAGCTLIDYERVVDDDGRRLVFFGPYAGLAGMIDSLWALGQRLQHEGLRTPFAAIQPAHRYADLAHARRSIEEVGRAIHQDGLPAALQPFVCGFAGYGQVSQGAQQVYDWLGVQEVAPGDLATLQPAPHTCHKVVFREEHLVEPEDGTAAFDLQEYYDYPERYRPAFWPYAEQLQVLVNCIYWEPRYPKLLSRAQFQQLFGGGVQPRLRVVGDITCDIDGSLACTTRATEPGNPVYVYDPETGDTADGVAGTGPVVLAVDFLPCELPVDASQHFSADWSRFVPGLARADFTQPLAASGLPIELQRATIVYRGALTDDYRYLEEHLAD